MLRGTLNKRYKAAIAAGRPTLQNQVDALKVQVGKNRAETQYYRGSGVHTSGGTAGATEITNIVPTTNLVASGTFRDKVTGDKWVNKFLKLRFVSTDDCQVLRVIVYFPKRAGTRFAPSSFRLTEIPDPSAFWVLRDQTFTQKDASGRMNAEMMIGLRGKMTLYDSDSALLERGELVVCVMSQGSTATTTQFNYGYELAYCNK